MKADFVKALLGVVVTGKKDSQNIRRTGGEFIHTNRKD